MVNEEALRYYREAGSIASKVRSMVASIVKEGVKVLDVCEEIEGLIFKMGGRPAFPCNIGINEVAAHYTSPPGDKSLIPRGSIVKVDFGVELSGYIADTATTITFDPEFSPMLKAAEDSLAAAIAFIREGVEAKDVGKVIEERIKRYGYKPIKNLTGHKMERYILHTGKVIPNFPGIDGSKLREGEVYAVEPFVTTADGAGIVVERPDSHIFRLQKGKTKDKKAGAMVELIKENYRTLPFALRWLKKIYVNEHWERAFKAALSQKCLSPYPVLVEARGEPVAQVEHTIIVKEDGCEVLTL
ncbi:TPA: type II methionyl aminopeptidase [Candidatus Bathyarchaeota archaeon]|nr:type II methionyl aminopeptidase [Candidatus Bathyarchaeota archaeon]